jgi:hypothetical protein
MVKALTFFLTLFSPIVGYFIQYPGKKHILYLSSESHTQIQNTARQLYENMVQLKLSQENTTQELAAGLIDVKTYKKKINQFEIEILKIKEYLDNKHFSMY